MAGFRSFISYWMCVSMLRCQGCVVKQKYVIYTTYLYCTVLYMPSYVHYIIDFKTNDLFLEDNSSVVKLFVIRDVHES